MARVAGGANPDEVTPEDSLPHSQEYHPNDLPWIECLIDLSDGATGAACATGKTEPDIFRTRVFRDFIFEVRV